MSTVWLTALLWVTLAGLSWQLDHDLPSRLSAEELSKGRRLYEAYCERCHGQSGDSTGYSGITPLTGLALRLSDSRLDQFRGPSFYAWGRFFRADEAGPLMAHILTLKGEKDYRDPRWLVSPYLLSRKLANPDYLIIDVRGESSYLHGHVPGAINRPWNSYPSDRLISIDDESGRPKAGVIILIYDEGSGLGSALLWLQLIRSGYSSVAVLDGGFSRWTGEGHPVEHGNPPSRAHRHRIREAGHVTEEEWVRSRPPATRHLPPVGETSREAGIPDSAHLSDYFRSLGLGESGLYALNCPPERTALIVLQLRLLGKQSSASLEKGLLLVH